jgi:glycyl-tRNA synthetase beta chain
MADKLDQLAGFFAKGEKPSGSGDPFALRRAALGVIRTIREHQLRVSARTLILEALGVEDGSIGAKLGIDDARQITTELLDFILDRLRNPLRIEGFPSDILTAAIGTDDDILRIIARAEALRALIDSDAGKSLLAAYKRAQNILRIEDKKDGPHTGPIDPALLTLPQEIALESALTGIEPQVAEQLAAEEFTGATHALASLRAPLDAFFTDIMVNDPDPALRKNRLRLLSRLKSAMESVADLSKIEA